MARIVFFLGCIFWSLASFGQTDSCNLRISLLTCGPGDDLYSVFGHTAVRVTDKTTHTDIVYNYGTFDFTDPDFYIKFTKGKLLYYVAAEEFGDFMYEYQVDKRSVIEQVLNLSCSEKQRLSEALQINAREENKYYFYEFLFDNCATRIRDILKKNTDDTIHVKDIRPHPVPTFREMLHVCLDSGKQYWSEFGIDLVLGSLIDRKPTNDETMFLPDYLMKGLDSASMEGVPLTKTKTTILPARTESESAGVFTPVNTFVFLLFAAGLLTLYPKKWTLRILDIFDVLLFFLIGGVGCFLIFMWVGTEHDLTANNYNLIWALPTHLFISFFLLKNKNWVRKYFLFTTVLYLLVLLCWAIIPQGMNAAFLPLILLLGLRSFARARKK